MHVTACYLKFPGSAGLPENLGVGLDAISGRNSINSETSKLSQGGFAAILAESLWLSGMAGKSLAAAPPRRQSLEIQRRCFGKPEAFRKDSGKAATALSCESFSTRAQRTKNLFHQLVSR